MHIHIEEESDDDADDKQWLTYDLWQVDNLHEAALIAQMRKEL